MIKFKIEYPIGAAHIQPNEAAGLKLVNISSHAELTAAENLNIAKAEAWAFAEKRSDFLSEKFFRELHKKMFSSVWMWAGTYRSSEKHLGIEWYKIPTELNKIISDTNYWIANKTYLNDEIAVRFHQRLLWVFPFPNGNGRWAQTMTDVLLFNLDQERFSWGKQNQIAINSDNQEARANYIESLKQADSKDFTSLLKFARS